MAEAPKAPYVHQSYPAWRYHRDSPAQKVNDPNEDAALGFGWVDSPARVNEPYEDPAAPRVRPSGAGICATCGQALPTAKVASVAPPVPASKPVPEPPQPVIAGKTVDALEKEAETAQFSSTVSGIAAAIGMQSDTTILQNIRAREFRNPKGARKGVVEALDVRLRALGVTVPDTAPSAEPEPEPADQ